MGCKRERLVDNDVKIEDERGEMLDQGKILMKTGES